MGARRPPLHERLHAGVAAALIEAGVPESAALALAEGLPRKWEKLGDVALFASAASQHDIFACAQAGGGGVAGDAADARTVVDSASSRVLDARAASEALRACAAIIGVSRIGVQAPVEPSEHRKSRALLLWPEAAEPSGWVRHRENGITYAFDVTRNMFASGNGTERMRAGRLCTPGETVVDLYAGIGYFTLPYLVHGRAAHVHACEWDEDALLALRSSLEANGVASRCTVHPGDNADALPSFRAQADRISLGLIPSSEKAWPLAVAALKPAGGWLHVHANVGTADGARDAWCAHLVSSLRRHAAAAGREWACVDVVHVERVKSYAPKIEHVVADVQIVAASSTTATTSSSAHGDGAWQ